VDVKVFISWSGELSQSIARVLYDWLPSVAQHVEPWMSDEEIKSGTRWNDEVVNALDKTGFGIICVTAANEHKPWLMFEAGALAKRLGDDAGRVVPLGIDLVPAEITGPLATFQGRKLDKEGMGRLVEELMALRENPPTKEQTARVFGRAWPELKALVDEAKQKNPNVKPARRSAEDMLEELVERVRRLDRIESRGVGGTAYVKVGERTRDAVGGDDFIRFIPGEPPPVSRRRDTPPSTTDTS
jgi:hypothetical protein